MRKSEEPDVASKVLRAVETRKTICGHSALSCDEHNLYLRIHQRSIATRAGLTEPAAKLAP